MVSQMAQALGTLQGGIYMRMPKVYMPQYGSYELQPIDGDWFVKEAECYLKSEMDRYVLWKNYKYCYSLAWWCLSQCELYHARSNYEKIKFYAKWHKRWVKIANHYKGMYDKDKGIANTENG